jgi:hypothetical protein
MKMSPGGESGARWEQKWVASCGQCEGATRELYITLASFHCIRRATSARNQLVRRERRDALSG